MVKLLTSMLGWVDERFPLTANWKAHLSEYYAPKNFNFWYYFGSLAMLVLLGAADMISVFIRSSLVQLNTPDRMRGRVSSISGLAISASNELGEMQSGLAAAVLGATGAVVFGGAGAIVVTALWAWMFPQLRQAKTFAPEFLPDNIDLKTAPKEAVP